MANNEDMASRLLERANKVYAIGLKNINLQIQGKIIGI